MHGDRPYVVFGNGLASQALAGRRWSALPVMRSGLIESPPRCSHWFPTAYWRSRLRWYSRWVSDDLATDSQPQWGTPGTFATVIGVSDYSFLEGNGQEAGTETFGLGQLYVPAATALILTASNG